MMTQQPKLFLLIVAICCIFAIGLVMIFNTTSAEVLDHALHRSTHQALIRQIMYSLTGCVFATGMWYVGYRNLLKYSPLLLLLFTILLAITLIPGIGREVNGSRRWLSIAGISLQPSEFVKYLIPAYFIYRFLQFKNQELSFRDFLQLTGIVAIPMALILVEPNNGTVGVIALTLIMLFGLTRISVKYWALPLLIFCVIGCISAYNLHYVSARLKVYWNPELDLQGKGHQPHQAKIAAGSGKLWGVGPGNSLQKLSYLPEAQNDYIAAIYAEEFGFMGMMFLIALYMTIGFVGFSIANQAPDRAGFFLAASITFLLCFQAFMNLGVVSGLLPSTGLNLPLFSQGGTSLIAHLMALGILLNIAYQPVGSRQQAVVSSQ